MSEPFTGIYAALTTPFLEDAVSVVKFKENIQKYNHTGLSGYVVLGSTGENVFLSDEEAESLLAAAVETASPEKTVIAGTSHESVNLTIGLTNRAAALGADAALVKPPHYYKSKMTQEAIKKFYLAVADAAQIPVIIYNIPQNVIISIEPQTVIELAQHPSIVAIKDSSGNLINLIEAKPHMPDNFSFLIGHGSVLLPGLIMGASGAILAIASAIPSVCVKLYSLYREGKDEEARRLQFELAPLNKALTQTLGIPAIKYALDRLGFYGGPVRSPLLALDEERKAEVEFLLKTLGLLK